MFVFSEKRAEKLIYESLLNEKLSSFLMKNYETGVPETDSVLFVKLCEFFMCNRAIYEAITAIELEKEKFMNVLFDPGHDMEERIITEQFNN